MKFPLTPLSSPRLVDLSIHLLATITINDKRLTQFLSFLLDYLLRCVKMKHAHLFLPQRVSVTELATIPSSDSAYTHTVYGLIGGINYTVWMTSSTEQGDGGIQSDPQTVFLPECGQSYIHMPTHTHTRIHIHTYKCNNCALFISIKLGKSIKVELSRK